ncbi:MAG: hypothetical protein DIU74_001295 [Pseudomonadota bacterium]|nr:MAG: hypothetical protein DIU74_12290 [Pseudomonadota bacterium]
MRVVDEIHAHAAILREGPERAGHAVAAVFSSALAPTCMDASASEIRTRFEQGEIRRAEGDAAMRHVMRGSCMPEVRRPCQAAPFKGEARAA